MFYKKSEPQLKNCAKKTGTLQTLAKPSPFSKPKTQAQPKWYNSHMDTTTLQSLLSEGETLRVEFKSRADDNVLVESVVCLANGRGGWLLVGVDDQGNITGAEPRHGQNTDPRRLQALIANRTEPAVDTAVQVVPINGKEVITVEVPVGQSVVSTKSGKFLRRTLDIHGQPECLPMRPHEVVGRAGSIGVLDFSSVTLSTATKSDLSDAEFSRFREMAESDGDKSLTSLSGRDLLQALNLTDSEENITVGALLLFGKEEAIAEHLPAYEVGFQELDHLQVRVNEIRRIPLLKAMAEISDRVRARNSEEEMDFGSQRIGLPHFAEITIRELIANALIHRDYADQGMTLVQIRDGTLTVSNPGGLPEGMTLANLITAPPQPRNPRLVDAFKRAGLVERTGRGIARIFEGQLSLGRPTPDYGGSDPRQVVARVFPGSADKQMVRQLREGLRNGQRFSLQDLMEIYETRNEYQFQSQTAPLPRIYPVPDEPETGLRQQAIRRARREVVVMNRARWERLVMNHVEANGSITRSEAAELCRIDPTRATQLLRRLRDQGRLRMEGSRRTAVYVKA